jgi:predicted nucleotidyltransferase
MIQGLSDREIQLLRQLVVNPLKQAGYRVWIFGSRARGDFKKFSDIDLLFTPPQGQETSKAFLSELEESLENSALVYKVDLVEESQLAQSYRDNVINDRVPL